MERILLKAEKRELATKGTIRKLRVSGKVPAIFYGKKKEPQIIAVNVVDLLKATSTKAGINVLLDLAVGDEKPATVLIRDYQAHPINRNFTHVDFQAIDVKERIVIEVPIELVGLAAGVKEGGILEQLLRKIELKCLPTQIPERIEINVEHLMIGDSIHSEGLKLPEGAEFAKTMNYTIATVVPPAKEEVPTAAVAEEVPVEGAPPAEGAAEGAAAAPGAAPRGAPGAAPPRGAPGAAPPKGAPGAAPPKGAPGAAPPKGAPGAAPPKGEGGEKAKGAEKAKK